MAKKGECFECKEEKIDLSGECLIYEGHFFCCFRCVEDYIEREKLSKTNEHIMGKEGSE